VGLSGTKTGFAGAELELTAELSRLPEARNWADAAAQAFGFDEMVRYQIKMAVSEGVANAVEHGSSSSTDQIRLRAVSEGNALAFYIRDTGKFIPRMARRGDLPERGRGLALMATMVDEVDVKPSGEVTVVRLVMHAAQAA
jgi:anti-sigma regulatory factor (Ser/Thr protein kinase)